MGLVCDNSTQIEKVYSAVFPSVRVMQSILEKNEHNVLLFVHHPMVWDIREATPFQPMEIKLLRLFKWKNISIYNLHVPLDNNGKYSTSVTFAEALGIKFEKSFAPYHGGMAGVFGHTELTTVRNLGERFSKAVGHYTSLYRYGDNEINGNKVAVIAGGGNEVGELTDAANPGINTFLTGVTILNDHSRPAHEFAKEKKINILGGTHYSTEKFACIAMCDYFKKLGLPCEFIEDIPVLEDL
jgi:putative NIF3 family GTP cyclohydrolase 1 type 2